MALSIFNISVGVEYTDETIHVKIENNTITGLIGKFIGKLLNFKNIRNWTLKPVKCLEADNNHPNLKNNSFIFMAKNKLIDVLAFPRKNRFDNENLEKSNICFIQPHQLGHILPKPTNSENTDLSTFLFSNKNFLIIILIGYLIVILINLIIISLINFEKIQTFQTKFRNNEKIENLKNLKSKKKIYRNLNFIKIKFADLLFLNYSRSSFKIALIVTFFEFFLFFNINILTSAINTDSIVVRTDEILNHPYKLLNSSKKFVFDEEDKGIYARSPKSSFLFKLYNKKVIRENNYYEVPIESTKRQNEGLRILISNFFSFFIIKDRTTRTSFFSYVAHLYGNHQFLYLDNISYFEESYIIFLRKSLNKDIKIKIKRSIDRYFETGIYSKIWREIHDLNLAYIQSKIRTYFHEEEFIQDYSSSADVDLNNFRNIFLYFFLITILLFFIFILNLLIIFLKFCFACFRFDLIFDYAE